MWQEVSGYKKMTATFANSLTNEFQSLHACNPQINYDNFCALFNDHSYAGQWCEPTCYKVHVVQVDDFALSHETSVPKSSGRGSSSGNEEDDSQKLIAYRHRKASTNARKIVVHEQCSKGHSSRRRWASSRAQETKQLSERLELERRRHAAFMARETTERHLKRLALKRKAWAEFMAERNELLINSQKMQLDQERKSSGATKSNKNKLQAPVTSLSDEKQIFSLSCASLTQRLEHITEKHENKLRSAVTLPTEGKMPVISSSVPLSQRLYPITQENGNKLQHIETNSSESQRISSSNVPLFQRFDFLAELQKASLVHPNMELVGVAIEGKNGLAVLHIEQNLTQYSHFGKIMKEFQLKLSSVNDTYEEEEHCYAKRWCEDDKGLHDNALSSKRIPSMTSELRGPTYTWEEANTSVKTTSEEQNADERLHPDASYTTCPQLYPHMIKIERTETVQEKDKFTQRNKQKKRAFTSCCEDLMYLNEQIDFYS